MSELAKPIDVVDEESPDLALVEVEDTKEEMTPAKELHNLIHGFVSDVGTTEVVSVETGAGIQAYRVLRASGAGENGEKYRITQSVLTEHLNDSEFSAEDSSVFTYEKVTPSHEPQKPSTIEVYKITRTRIITANGESSSPDDNDVVEWASTLADLDETVEWYPPRFGHPSKPIKNGFSYPLINEEHEKHYVKFTKTEADKEEEKRKREQEAALD